MPTTTRSDAAEADELHGEERGEHALSATVSELELGDAIERAATDIWHEYCAERSIQGRDVDSLATAAVGVAVRAVSAPVTFNEVIQTSSNPKQVNSAYRELLRTLDVEISPPDPTDYLDDVATGIDVPDEVEPAAAALIQAYKQDGAHAGKNPWGIAAGAIYTVARAAGREDVHQATVADAGNVCVTTVRDRDEELREYVDSVDVSSIPVPESAEPVLRSSCEEPSDVESWYVELTTETEQHRYEYPDVERQADLLLSVLKVVDDRHNLFERIDLPYSGVGCNRYFLTDDPSLEDERHSWEHVDNGVYADTRLDMDGKSNRLDDLVGEIGFDLTIGSVSGD